MAKQIMNTLESNETKVFRALHKQVDTGSIPEELIPKIEDSPEIYRKRLIQFLLTHYHINTTTFTLFWYLPCHDQAPQRLGNANVAKDGTCISR